MDFDCVSLALATGSECMQPQIQWHRMLHLRLLVTLLTVWGVVVVANVDNPFAFI
jgi:hypothetical protein